MSTRTAEQLMRTAAVLACSALVFVGLAHEWSELDGAAALADADVALTITEAFLADPLAHATPEEPRELVGWPPELGWWMELTARLEAADAEGSQRRIAIIADVAPAWTDGEPADGEDHLRWRATMGELVAHAAARSLTDADVASAEATLADSAAAADDAERASWIVVLPRLSDDERRDLSAAFERLDALVREGFE